MKVLHRVSRGAGIGPGCIHAGRPNENDRAEGNAQDVVVLAVPDHHGVLGDRGLFYVCSHGGLRGPDLLRAARRERQRFIERDRVHRSAFGRLGNPRPVAL